MLKKHFSKFVGLMLLFSSKLGGLLIGLVFVPVFNNNMSADSFGFVALFMTLQALVLLLDFGLSILLSRYTALSISEENSISKIYWFNSEVIISAFYFILLFLLLVIKNFNAEFFPDINSYQLCLIVFSLWATILQNLCQTLLLAGKRFTISSLTLIGGNILRVGGSALVVKFISPTIDAYIISQTILSIILLIVTRQLNNIYLFDVTERKVFSYKTVKKMLYEGRSLIIYNLSAAVILNLDKLIVSHNISLVALAPYFLASSLCIVPISALSGPVMQFFQPGLTKAIYKNAPNTVKLLRYYVITLSIFTLGPSFILWEYRHFFISLWLGHSLLIDTVASYTYLLLPGVAIGGLGYLSYVILIAVEDFKFQSALSLLMTSIVVVLVFYFSSEQDVKSICITYALYHTISTALTWGRCLYLSKTRVFALDMAKTLIIVIPILIIIYIIFNFIISKV